MASTEENRRDVRAAEVAREEDGGGSEGSSMSYEDLLNLYDESMRNLAEGEVVTGRVIDVTNNDVIVDVGYKSEGLIPLEEFRRSRRQDPRRDRRPRRGAPREHRGPGRPRPALQDQGRADEGLGADRGRLQATASRSTGRVIDRIKGGLTVDVGLRAFLPGSLADIKPIKNLESLPKARTSSSR
jgi:small subunit ribosomal protein S1